MPISSASSATLTGCLLFLLALPGCGSKPSAEDPETARTNIELQEVGLLYREFVNEKKRPPTRLADLQQYEPGYPLGYRALQSGECVLYWGAPLSGGAVLAYEKEVPKKGGWVLLQDGTTKQMTAEEFQAAPKARK